MKNEVFRIINNWIDKNKISFVQEEETTKTIKISRNIDQEAIFKTVENWMSNHKTGKIITRFSHGKIITNFFKGGITSNYEEQDKDKVKTLTKPK